MKKVSIWLMVVGVIAMIVGVIISRNLSHVNAVDSHRWTININGILSFGWPTYSGFILFMVGVCFNIGSWKQKNMYE